MSIKPAVVMMVRDESDIIWGCLLQWQQIGVRDFYLCDNGSVDGTLDLLFQWRDWIKGNVHIYQDSATDWPGRRVINGLKDKAIEDGCNWIFPADADEFLRLPEEFTLQSWIESLGNEPGWGELPYLNILPDGRKYWQEPHRKAFGVITKEMAISMGNHLIEGVAPTIKAHGAYYEHYSLRSYPQFKKKMENYMTAFSQTQYQDHPHALDFHKWKEYGEDFLKERWYALTGLNA